MSVKLTEAQLQDRLPELLDAVVQTGAEYVVQRNGKDCAVLVSAKQWRRRRIGASLDAAGPLYRLSPEKQARADALLTKSKRQALSLGDRRELKALLEECDEIMLRRSQALDRNR